MSQARNFNVGDVVIDFQDMSLWNNPYHHKKTLNTFRKLVVVAANDKYFTTVPGIDLDKFSGLSDYREKMVVCEQRNGRGFDGSQAFVNLTTRRRDIEAHLQKLFAEETARLDKEDAAAIAQLEAEIAFKKQQIEIVRAGKRKISYDTKFVARELSQECMDDLLKVIQ